MPGSWPGGSEPPLSVHHLSAIPAGTRTTPVAAGISADRPAGAASPRGSDPHRPRPAQTSGEVPAHPSQAVAAGSENSGPRADTGKGRVTEAQQRGLNLAAFREADTAYWQILAVQATAPEHTLW